MSVSGALQIDFSDVQGVCLCHKGRTKCLAGLKQNEIQRFRDQLHDGYLPLHWETYIYTLGGQGFLTPNLLVPLDRYIMAQT